MGVSDAHDAILASFAADLKKKASAVDAGGVRLACLGGLADRVSNVDHCTDLNFGLPVICETQAAGRND